MIHEVLFRVCLIDLSACHLDALALIDNLQHALGVVTIPGIDRNYSTSLSQQF